MWYTRRLHRCQGIQGSVFEYAQFAVRNPSHVTRHWRSQWATRKALLAYRKANPVCEATGNTSSLQVHHVLPVSIFPELAADPSNFITLCKQAHFAVGHGGNWKDFNPHVREMSAMLRAQVVETQAYKEPDL